MQFKIILLFIICATFQTLKTSGRKRIKRQFNLVTHDKRLEQDFVVLPNEKQAHLKAAFYETFSTAAPYSNNSKNLLSDAKKDHNTSRPLIEILRKAEHQSLESRKEDVNVGRRLTTDNKTREEKSLILPDKRCHVSAFVEKPIKHHKTKHVPHSREIFEAKIVIPSQQIKPALQALGSYDSRNLNNMIMYKVGLDSSPAHYFYPKMLLTQNSPILYEEENLNGPSSLDYFFNSFGTAKDHSLYRQGLRRSNSPTIDNSWPTHAASAKEPTQLASLMQNALDTLLAGSEDIEGTKNTQQIVFSCPMHQSKETAQIEGDGADVIQVCSCRLVKKAKDDGIKKS